MFCLEENNTINALNTMKKSASSPVIQCAAVLDARSIKEPRHISLYLHTAADICHFTSLHVIKWSIFQFIKNYLRSTTTDERLNELALLFVHPDITLDYDAVIDEFEKSNCRLQFC